MTCNRNGCRGVGKNYSPSFGYLCNECTKELKQSKGINVSLFMTEHKSNNINQIAWELYIDDEFQV